MDAKDLLVKYREERKQHLNQARQLEALIRRLESDLGEPAETEGDADEVIIMDELASPPSKKPTTIHADEFFGMTHGDAARKYLEKIGKAVSLEELVDALNKGGCKVGGTEPKRTLYISLVRNTREFAKVPGGYIGLRKFYPNLKSDIEKTRKKTKKRGK